MRYFISIAGAVGLLIAGACTPLYAEGPAQAALAGLSEVKLDFDMRNGDAKGLLRELNVIDATRESLIQPGVKPTIVIAFRGPATTLVQTHENQIKAED